MSAAIEKADTRIEQIVVVGPTLLDHFHVGAASRLDQTAPIPRVDVGMEYCMPGGGANAAMAVSNLAVPTALVTVLNPAYPAEPTFEKVGVSKSFAVYPAYVEKYVQPCKHRVYAGHRLVSRFDVEEQGYEDMSKAVLEAFDKCVTECKPTAILLSDYNKGVCTPAVIRAILDYAEAEGIPVVVDPVPEHFKCYAGAAVVCPNGLEATAGAVHAPSVAKMAEHIRTEYAIRDCVITLGGTGAVCSDATGTKHVPAMPSIEVDSCGAGDVVAACLTYCQSLGVSMEDSTIFSMAAGSLAVEQPGCSAVYLHQIHARKAEHIPTSRVVTLAEAEVLRASISMAGGSVAIANGVFDLLHPEHLVVLEEAAAQAQYLFVLLNSDESASRIKRVPVADQVHRATMLAAQPCVDAVVLFDGDTPIPEISRLKPDVLVKGSQCKGTEVPGADLLEGWGGRMHFAQHTPTISTTALIEKARNTSDDDAENSATTAAAGGDDATRVSED